MQNILRRHTNARHMNRRAAITMGLLSLLFGRKASSKQEVKILPIGTDVEKELARQAELANSLLRKYTLESVSFTPEQIDVAIAAWSKAEAPGKESADQVVEQLGAYFGQYLARTLELEWRLYRDSRGTDLCVVHKRVSVFSFPHSAIYKAAVQGRRDALPEVEAALRRQISEALNSSIIQPRPEKAP